MHYNLKCFDLNLIPLPPYLSDEVWLKVIEKTNPIPRPPPIKRPRGRPPIHGYYCKRKLAYYQKHKVDEVCKDIKIRVALEWNREYYQNEIREGNKRRAKKYRDNLKRIRKEKGIYRARGRPSQSKPYYS